MKKNGKEALEEGKGGGEKKTRANGLKPPNQNSRLRHWWLIVGEFSWVWRRVDWGCCQSCRCPGSRSGRVPSYTGGVSRSAAVCWTRWGCTSCHAPPPSDNDNIHAYHTIRDDASFTCARKPTWGGLIYRTETTTHTHTQTHLTALCPGLPGWAGTRKVNQSDALPAAQPTASKHWRQ